MKRKTKKLLTGILTGVAAGSAAAFLLAPKKGSELRNDIAEGTVKSYDKVKDFSKHSVGNIKTTAIKTKDKIKAAYNAGVDTYKREGEKIKTSTEIIEEALTEENPNRI